jgi:hypothetical protein
MGHGFHSEKPCAHSGKTHYGAKIVPHSAKHSNAFRNHAKILLNFIWHGFGIIK